MSPPPQDLRPIALQVENFRGWLGQHQISLDRGLTLVLGDNGAGKSSLVNAIEWCLFGSDIAKKGCGIAERADWEIPHRLATGHVEVRLELSVSGERRILRRRRPVDAKQRDLDEVLLETPDGSELLRGEAAQQWLQSSGLPDWPTWRHAFCQHQEDQRSRLTDGRERSNQLAQLLGLASYQDLILTIKNLKASELAKIDAAERSSIEERLRLALKYPGQELQDFEDRLHTSGIAKSSISDSLIRERVVSLFEAGRRLAEPLGLHSEIPEDQQATEAIPWGRNWQTLLRQQQTEIESKIGPLQNRRTRLQAALPLIEPADRKHKDALEALNSFEREHGDHESIRAQITKIDGELEELRRSAQLEDSTQALLRSAAELMTKASETECCPVCEHDSPELRNQIESRLAAGQTATSKNRQDTRRAAEERRSRLEEQDRERTRLEQTLKGSAAAFSSLSNTVSNLLPEFTGDLADLHQTATSQLNGWSQQIETLQTLRSNIDTHQNEHRSALASLELLTKWQRANSRTESASTDVFELPSFLEFQRASDAAAGFASDLEIMQNMTRELQEAASATRVAEVNASLGGYFAAITGRESSGVQVSVHATPSKLTYHIIDESGNQATPILNQGALNALSISLLLAQAEDRARRGQPEWLILDDPGQSLDEKHRKGLARALRMAAQHAPVLVASMDDDFAKALSGEFAEDRRILSITGEAGKRVLEEVTR